MAKILESELVKPDGNKYFTIEWDSLPPDATFITPKLWYYTKSQSSI